MSNDYERQRTQWWKDPRTFILVVGLANLAGMAIGYIDKPVGYLVTSAIFVILVFLGQQRPQQQRSNDGVSFVVIAIGAPEGPLWVTGPVGHHGLSESREDATEFSTRQNAQSAIQEIKRDGHDSSGAPSPLVFYAANPSESPR